MYRNYVIKIFCIIPVFPEEDMYVFHDALLVLWRVSKMRKNKNTQIQVKN
jgi:hypothetical protein